MTACADCAPMRWTFENDQPIVAHQMFANGCPRMRPQSKKQLFEKSGKQLFAKARARRRDAFAKSCFRAAFCPRLVRDFFVCVFFSFSYQLLAPWFEIIAPRALKKCVATTISKNKAHFLPPGVLSMVASRARSPGTLLSPRRHIFPDFWISCFRRCPYVFWFVVPYFSHRADQFFAPEQSFFDQFGSLF